MSRCGKTRPRVSARLSPSSACRCAPRSRPADCGGGGSATARRHWAERRHGTARARAHDRTESSCVLCELCGLQHVHCSCDRPLHCSSVCRMTENSECELAPLDRADARLAAADRAALSPPPPPPPEGAALLMRRWELRRTLVVTVYSLRVTVLASTESRLFSRARTEPCAF